jgi:type IV pilus assembly protein PilM
VGTIGVDFGSRGVKLLQLRENDRRLAVIGAATVDMPIGDPSETNPTLLSERLCQAVAAGGFLGRRCVVSVPRSDVRTQSIRLPRMPESELVQAVIWEASQRFELDRAAMEVDFVRTGASLQNGENREEVFIIAVPHAALHARLEPLLSAGLRPSAVDTDFAALARTFSRCCRRESDQMQVRAIVEVGPSGSIVMILRGDQIAFCKPLSISGEQFDKAVVEHLELDVEAASELRSARINAVLGLEDHTPPDPATHRAVFEAVRPLMGDLVQEVVLCIRYYGVTFRGHPPDRIILAGGDGLEPQLDNMLHQACKIPVACDDDAGTLERLTESLRTRLSRMPGPTSRWAAAAGLSLRGLASGSRRVNRPETTAQKEAA